MNRLKGMGKRVSRKIALLVAMVFLLTTIVPIFDSLGTVRAAAEAKTEYRDGVRYEYEIDTDGNLKIYWCLPEISKSITIEELNKRKEAATSPHGWRAVCAMSQNTNIQKFNNISPTKDSIYKWSIHGGNILFDMGITPDPTISYSDFTEYVNARTPKKSKVLIIDTAKDNRIKGKYIHSFVAWINRYTDYLINGYESTDDEKKSISEVPAYPEPIPLKINYFNENGDKIGFRYFDHEGKPLDVLNNEGTEIKELEKKQHIMWYTQEDGKGDIISTANDIKSLWEKTSVASGKFEVNLYGKSVVDYIVNNDSTKAGYPSQILGVGDWRDRDKYAGNYGIYFLDNNKLDIRDLPNVDYRWNSSTDGGGADTNSYFEYAINTSDDTAYMSDKYEKNIKDTAAPDDYLSIKKTIAKLESKSSTSYHKIYEVNSSVKISLSDLKGNIKGKYLYLTLLLWKRDTSSTELKPYIAGLGYDVYERDGEEYAIKGYPLPASLQFDFGGGSVKGNPDRKESFYEKADNQIWASPDEGIAESSQMPTLIRDGFEFAGWYTSANGGKKIVSSNPGAGEVLFSDVWNDANVENGDFSIKLYAKWMPLNYKITYNMGEGKLNESAAAITDEKRADGYNKYNPVPNNKRYAFDGWYTDAYDGEKIVDLIDKDSSDQITMLDYLSGLEADSDGVVRADLHARFALKHHVYVIDHKDNVLKMVRPFGEWRDGINDDIKYDITFDNKDTLSISGLSKVELRYDNNATDADFSKFQYSYWLNTLEDDDYYYYFGNLNIGYVSNKFEYLEKNYKTLDCKDGTKLDDKDVYLYDLEEDYTVNLSDLEENEGIHGKYLYITLAQKAYNTYPSLETRESAAGIGYDTKKSYHGGYPMPIRLEFDFGGINAEDGTQADYNDKKLWVSRDADIYSLDEMPTLKERKGYELDGWKTADGKKIVSSNPGENEILFSKLWADTNVTGNKFYTTLYANWKIIDYDITYELGDGVDNPGNPTSYNVESNDITLTAPTREGFLFEGWKESEGDSPQKDVTIPHGSIGNKRYIAVWKDENKNETLRNRIFVRSDGVYFGENNYKANASDLDLYGITYEKDVFGPKLTLKNTDIDIKIPSGVSGEFGAITFEGVHGKLILEGVNKLRLRGENSGDVYGIKSQGQMTISGSGNQVIDLSGAISNDGNSYGIHIVPGSELTIENKTTVSINNAGTANGESIGISSPIIENRGILTVDNSGGQANKAYGIYTESLGNYSDLTAIGGSGIRSSYGLYIDSKNYESITENGTLTCIEGETLGKNKGAIFLDSQYNEIFDVKGPIVADGSIYMDYANVSVYDKATITIKSDSGSIMRVKSIKSNSSQSIAVVGGARNDNTFIKSDDEYDMIIFVQHQHIWELSDDNNQIQAICTADGYCEFEHAKGGRKAIVEVSAEDALYTDEKPYSGALAEWVAFNKRESTENAGLADIIIEYLSSDGKVVTEPLDKPGTYTIRAYTDDANQKQMKKTFNIHGPGKEYGYDDKNHWHKCIIEGCSDDEHVFDIETHSFDDKTHLCVCGLKDPHEHTFSEKWTSDDDAHWHEATCEHKTEKSDYDKHSWEFSKAIKEATDTEEGEAEYKCSVCERTKIEKVKIHEHTFSDEWTSDDDGHWHAATCEHVEEKDGYEKHTWDYTEAIKEPTCTEEGEGDYVCSICGRQKTGTIPATGHDFSDNAEYCRNDCGTANPDFTYEHFDRPDDEEEEVTGNTSGYIPSRKADKSTGKNKKSEGESKPKVVVEQGPDNGFHHNTDNEAGNVSGSELNTAPDSLQRTVLTPAEIQVLADGGNIDVWIEVEEINEPSDEEVNEIKGAADNGFEVGSYYNIDLLKQVEGEESVKVTELFDGKVSITIVVPPELRAPNRVYKVIRYHGEDGKAETLETTISGNRLTFLTDKLSTYAISYGDAPKHAFDARKDRAKQILLWITIGAAGLCVIIMFVYTMRKVRSRKDD